MSEHDSKWLSNGPCPDCGSTDACGLYDDGHTYCQACAAYTAGEGEESEADRLVLEAGDLFTDLSYGSLHNSGLSEKTCRMIGYATTTGFVAGATRGCHVCTYRRNGKPVAQHLRFMGDDGKKDFRWRGDAKRLELYGQHLWDNRSKKLLVITEGEKDMGSFVEASGGNWACVSVPNGASNAEEDLKHNLEWCNQYDKIILLFDMDEAGRAAADECVGLFAAGKCGIGVLPDGYKDANEMLLAGRGDDLKWIPWRTKPWSPDEVTGGDDLLADILATPERESIPYPWPGLNTLTLGCRVGEIVTVGAGTGVGKSEIVRQMAYAFRMEHDENIGYIALEESARTSALDFMGFFKKIRLRLRRSEIDDAEITSLYAKVIGITGREKIRFYKHFGSLDSKKLLSRIRYMAQGCDCKTIVLDHISIAVSGTESNNERKDIDVLMTALRSMVEELGLRCIVVSHLKRLQDGSHEEGARVSLSHFRGSGAIAQLSDVVIGAERNQQSPTKANYTQLRVLKNRWTGQLGAADLLKYDHATGLLEVDYSAGTEEFTSENNEPPDF